MFMFRTLFRNSYFYQITVLYILYYVIRYIYMRLLGVLVGATNHFYTHKLYETETFLNASVNQKNAIKWNENRNKNGKTRTREQNRGISCWNFCELWQKSEMTQSVCPTSAINPLWNQLEPPPVAPLFPLPIPTATHCQRVKSIRAGCAPVQFDSCQSATLASFPPEFPLFPSFPHFDF